MCQCVSTSNACCVRQHNEKQAIVEERGGRSYDSCCGPGEIRVCTRSLITINPFVGSLAGRARSIAVAVFCTRNNPTGTREKTKLKRVQRRRLHFFLFKGRSTEFIVQHPVPPPNSAIVSVSAGIRVYLQRAKPNRQNENYGGACSLLHHARGMLPAISACLEGRVAVFAIWEIFRLDINSVARGGISPT